MPGSHIHRTAAACIMAVALLTAPSPAAAGSLDRLPDITNTRVHSGSVVSSGQPEREQFGAIAESGVEVVINLSPECLPDSIANEDDLVRSAGMEYRFIPVDWDKPAREDFQRFLEAMEASKGKVVLVHCWLNSRSSAFV